MSLRQMSAESAIHPHGVGHIVLVGHEAVERAQDLAVGTKYALLFDRGHEKLTSGSEPSEELIPIPLRMLLLTRHEMLQFLMEALI